ncbi:type II secretion system minor pseudopilin GspK [Sphingomonas sp. AR_OL41]|uniref:type II secretion system minor pseudopilin GspK n=1 Tax=Sphingomonas sp. AR_OL41 TaxID=3042729 RepID=UPI00247FDCB9|nr:type II secretion system minor pseudopilin GspK [Sphingomonas sp. AR_OL41]MDH7972276.1 type II secretion system minor pseudopilin GspK [Sphingomonas sp. AR_OL41]
MRPADRPGERGAALLTVLLLVAVIAVLAGTALEKLRLSTRIGGNAVALDQARAFAQAAEILAVAKVSDLLARDPNRVTLAGGWSDKPFPLPIPGGIATARVSDGGNCFNLNSLVVETGPGVYAAYTPARRQFARLIRLVGAPTSTPDGIAAATADWIDSDNAPVEQGSEDASYTGYRPADTLMADPSELRAVAGVTAAVYAKLRPWVCTLPKAEPSKINVNTLLPEQAALFAMLLPDTLSVDGARQMLLKRPPQGFASTSEFWKLPALSAITAGPDAEAQTSVTTKWFALRVDVTLGDADLEDHGLIDATKLPARLATRQWGEPS